MGNYVIGVGNYVIVSPSELGNCMIADIYLSGLGGAEDREFFRVISPL